MTIITKPISEKKEAKAKLPLVDNDQLASAPPEDIEGQLPDPSFILLRARARFVSTTATLCLLILALFVVGVGIIGGTYLYRQYRTQTFRGWCDVPYDSGETASLIDDANMFKEEIENAMFAKKLEIDLTKSYNNLMQNVFKERFEIDVENEDYEKIDVPDFRNGRAGRFVHDFNTNKTGIVDITGQRCFIMPLNRDNVLPPRTLEDLIKKMWDGYYKVDTQVIRETMRVVTPPVTDVKEIGEYIARECDGMRIYKLEKYENSLWKRSADPEENAKFAQFSGKGILEFDIVNLNDVLQFEREQGH